MAPIDPTVYELTQEVNRLQEQVRTQELRLQAVEAFILRRPTDPIPNSIIEQAIADRAPEVEPEEDLPEDEQAYPGGGDAPEVAPEEGEE